MAKTKTSFRKTAPPPPPGNGNVTYSTSGRVKVVRKKVVPPEKPSRTCYDSNGNVVEGRGSRCPKGTRSRKPGGKSGKRRAAIWAAKGSMRKCYNKTTLAKTYFPGARCPPNFKHRLSRNERNYRTTVKARS